MHILDENMAQKLNAAFDRQQRRFRFCVYTELFTIESQRVKRSNLAIIVFDRC